VGKPSKQASNIHSTTTQQKNRFTALCPGYPGELIPEEIFTHPATWSSSNLYQLLPATTIHSILPVHIMCLAILLHNLSLCPLWSTSWSGALHLIFHFFTQSVPSFRNTCPYHRNLFCCSTKIISSIPSLSHHLLLGSPSFTLTLHIHLTILISGHWSATSMYIAPNQQNNSRAHYAWQPAWGKNSY